VFVAELRYDFPYICMKGMRKTVNGNKITYLRFKIYLDYRAGVLTD